MRTLSTILVAASVLWACGGESDSSGTDPTDDPGGQCGKVEEFNILIRAKVVDVNSAPVAGAEVRVFESGRAFLRTDAAPDERRPDNAVKGYKQPRRIAALAYGLALDEQWGEAARPVDFFDVKGDVEALIAPQRAEFVKATHPALHPGRSARVELAGQAIGWIGEIHPLWQQQYELAGPAVVFELDLDPLLMVGLPRYREVSRFPAVVRDLAVVVDETTPAGVLLAALFADRPPIVQDVKLFDIYRGSGVENGRKSLAFRVVMQDTERTLTDAEVDVACESLVALWGRGFGATPRI